MAVLVAVVGAVRAFRSPASTGVLHDRREAEFVPVWIAVSWAFTSFLLAPVLNDASLVLLGTLLIAVTAGALVAELATDIAASTVTGVGAGSLLTLLAVRSRSASSIPASESVVTYLNWPALLGGASARCPSGLPLTRGPDESTRDYFVDPSRARGPGFARPSGTLFGIAVLLRGELMAGAPGACVMELGVCWAIVMALTGNYLFVRVGEPASLLAI